VIERPRRSVTRFFVPLIDVLILLFCIFLLMPFVSVPTEETPADASKNFEPSEPPKDLPTNVTELQRELERARREIKRLSLEKGDQAQRLSVRVLEIDPENGKLYYFQNGNRIEVKDQRDAQRLIDQHQRASGAREPFFLILYPRQRSKYPQTAEVEQYRHWFDGVSFIFDTPGRS
jgi:hypothetical protein